MSKTVELARHLSTLNINNMYKTDFYWTWDKTDDEIDAIFTVADALRDLRERNKSTRVFDSGLGISIFRDNSTRTRFSFASACNLLGLEVQDLDEKKSQIAHGETVRETANMVSFMADVIGIRDDMFIGEGHKYQKTFMDAVEGRLPRRYPGAAAHSGEPAVRCGPPHPVHGRYAARHPLLRRRGEPEGQEGRYDLGLFSLLRQAPVRAPGRDRPVHPLRHGRDPGPSRGL